MFERKKERKKEIYSKRRKKTVLKKERKKERNLQ